MAYFCLLRDKILEEVERMGVWHVKDDAIKCVAVCRVYSFNGHRGVRIVSSGYKAWGNRGVVEQRGEGESQ